MEAKENLGGKRAKSRFADRNRDNLCKTSQGFTEKSNKKLSMRLSIEELYNIE